LVTPDQLESWLHEIEIRPSSAAAIIRALAARLAELDTWNEELVADNIELRSGHRVEEYEQRLATLEYQLELVKRQANTGPASPLPWRDQESVLFFHPKGWILRLNLQYDQRISGSAVASFKQPFETPEAIPGMLATTHQDELLIVFDSGRTLKLPVEQLPVSAGDLDWREAYRVQPRPGEELVAVLPIADLTYYDYCVQISRRGCAKLMLKSSFHSLVAKGSIGAGIKKRPDKTAGLVFANRDDRIVISSHEGAVLSIPISLIPYSVDEVIQLPFSDHIVCILNPKPKTSLLAFTNTGKVILRESGWLEPAASFKSRGQALFSSARREGGVRVVGAAALEEPDWCYVLTADGKLTPFQVSELMAKGSVGDGASAYPLVGITSSISKR
jgi:DNA gyrase/topoisomerase IV subunit A